MEKRGYSNMLARLIQGMAGWPTLAVGALLLVVEPVGVSLSETILPRQRWSLIQKNIRLATLTREGEGKRDLWAPNDSLIPNNENGRLIRYGKELIVNTAQYLGPNGTVAKISNGMNCQNCHLNAGTKPFGNNYLSVTANYPKFRARSGTVETIVKRVNDCLERSLNGHTLDSNQKEMRAIVAYIDWLGRGVPKGTKVKGSGLVELSYLDRAASPAKGKLTYIAKCQSCHQPNGQGMPKPDSSGYQFPPLWGEHSYNNGAGLFRLSRLAGYLQANMPFGATAENPVLTPEEAWDLAAYINSRPRPDVTKTLMRKDWPDIKGKPIDHPFGPFADDYSENQHQFGPFKPIADALKKEMPRNK